MIVPLRERYVRYLSLLASPQLKNGSNPAQVGDYASDATFHDKAPIKDDDY